MTADPCTQHVHIKQCDDVKIRGCHLETCPLCDAGRNCCEHCELIR